MLSHANDIAQLHEDIVMAVFFLDNYEDSVVARHGSQHARQIATVDVVGNTAGIARACLDDAYVGREVDGDKTESCG